MDNWPHPPGFPLTALAICTSQTLHGTLLRSWRPTGPSSRSGKVHPQDFTVPAASLSAQMNLSMSWIRGARES